MGISGKFICIHSIDDTGMSDCGIWRSYLHNHIPPHVHLPLLVFTFLTCFLEVGLYFSSLLLAVSVDTAWNYTSGFISRNIKVSIIFLYFTSLRLHADYRIYGLLSFICVASLHKANILQSM